LALKTRDSEVLVSFFPVRVSELVSAVDWWFLLVSVFLLWFLGLAWRIDLFPLIVTLFLAFLVFCGRRSFGIRQGCLSRGSYDFGLFMKAYSSFF